MVMLFIKISDFVFFCKILWLDSFCSILYFSLERKQILQTTKYTFLYYIFI